MTQAGWQRDPRDPKREWYWDGTAYTGSRAVTSGRGWTSWPAIIIGFALCVVPGVVMLWLRPGTSYKVKGVLTALAALMVIVVARQPVTPAPTAATLQSAASLPTATRSLTPELNATPSPTSSSAGGPMVVPVPVPVPAPSPSEGSPTPTPTKAPAGAAGTALAVAQALPVKGRAPKTGYTRSQFGPAWVDVDRNGCDTRNDLLGALLTDVVMSGPCKVMSGTLADPYTGQSIEFVRGGASEVDIDHIVPLSDAWQKGAQQWQYAKRVAFANDPLNLQPTDASTNRGKGDGDAATWLPPSKAYRCTYVARIVAVKKKYGLWVTAAEKEAMVRVLSTCPTLALPGPGSQPTVASNTGGGPQPSTAPMPTPSPQALTGGGGGLDPRFSSCKAAKAAGFGPYRRGIDPEYGWYRDGDNDGVDCE